MAAREAVAGTLEAPSDRAVCDALVAKAGQVPHDDPVVLEFDGTAVQETVQGGQILVEDPFAPERGEKTALLAGFV